MLTNNKILCNELVRGNYGKVLFRSTEGLTENDGHENDGPSK